MSCGFAPAELRELMRPQEVSIRLHGGSPKADIKIKDEDIRTKRTTFMGKVGKMFGKVESLLKIQVKSTEKLGGTVLKDLEMLPKRGIFKVKSVNMISAYRGYLGKLFFKDKI